MIDRGSWFITRSIALELDVVMMIASEGAPTGRIAPALTELWTSLPAGWYREGAEILGLSRNIGSMLVHAALIAGSAFVEDYSQATLPIRELSTAEALARVAKQTQPLGFSPAPDLAPGPAFVDLRTRALVAFFQSIGFNADEESELVRRERAALSCVPRILRDGDAHTRFWHWLDHFYYTIYRPWRETRLEAMAILERHAYTALGGQAGDSRPDTSWLPPQNPLLCVPQISAAAQEGRLSLAFWVDPFELFDSISLDIGLVALTFGQPGSNYAGFHELSANIATRTSALADPTRLAILRLIRFLSMSNTDIATYLELARPTVSVHAKILREAGLIRTHNEGRQVRHEIDAEAVRQLFHDLERFLDLPT